MPDFLYMFDSFGYEALTSYASDIVVKFLLQPISSILLPCEVCEMFIKDVISCPVYLPKIL
jgi:hypothetical protein